MHLNDSSCCLWIGWFYFHEVWYKAWSRRMLSLCPFWRYSCTFIQSEASAKHSFHYLLAVCTIWSFWILSNSLRISLLSLSNAFRIVIIWIPQFHVCNRLNTFSTSGRSRWTNSSHSMHIFGCCEFCQYFFPIDEEVRPDQVNKHQLGGLDQSQNQHADVKTKQLTAHSVRFTT